MCSIQTRWYQAMAAPERDLRNANLSHLVMSYVRGRTLLDVGCGYGLYLWRAQQRGLTATGIEIEAPLVELAKQRFGDLDLENVSLEVYEPGRDFDNVLLIDVLETIEDDRAALERATRLLAPGGRLVLCVPAYSALYGTRDERMGAWRRYDRGPTEAMMRELGLRITTTRHWNALAVAPYYLLHRLLSRRREYDELRGAPSGGLRGLAARLLGRWYRHVENRIDFGFGLSLLLVAERQA